jgi:hypothetical protein
MGSTNRFAQVLAVAGLAVVPAAMAAESGFRMEKSFDLGSGGTLVVKSDAGGAEVRGGDGEKATVVVTSKRSDFAEKYDIRFEEAPGRLEVTIERKGKGLFQFSGWNEGGNVAIVVPRRTNVQVGSSGGGVTVESVEGAVKAKSSGGGVDVTDVEGDVEASSSGGGVEVQRIHGAAKLGSSGGSVTARTVSGDIDAESSGGGVRIDDAGGVVVASSSGGGVKVSFAAGNAKGGDLHSSGGGVTARLDPTVGLEIDAYSSGGDADCDLPVTVRGKMKDDTIQGKLNGGGAVLKLRSSGGGVNIESR